jgi:hypothetical protein
MVPVRRLLQPASSLRVVLPLRPVQVSQIVIHRYHGIMAPPLTRSAWALGTFPILGLEGPTCSALTFVAALGLSRFSHGSMILS